MTPGELYQKRLQSQLLQYDPQQERVLKIFDRLAQQLIRQDRGNSGFWMRLWHKRNPQRTPGIYLWGGVGRGKTMLMDIFYETLPFPEKKRTHFHQFMRTVHTQLKTLKQLSNPLQHVARNIAKECRVLCLDEFIVTDITDAMILSGLLEGLVERDVCLVTTSNTEPDELYKNGLQRSRFLPAIDLLKQHYTIINLDNRIDYRLQTFRRAGTYHCPLNEETDRHMQMTFEDLAAGGASGNGSIEINRRNLAFIAAAEGIVWFDFQTLCNSPRSQDDYIEIAWQHHTVFVSNIPPMNDLSNDATRRFLNLIDILYDHKVKLVVSAAVGITDLYTGKRLAVEFERTTSRLLEMQSEKYLAHSHLS